jgi:hypothetical protein
VLTNTEANTLHLILTVKYRVATFNATSWRSNLSDALCIPRSSVAVYEMSDVDGSNALAYLVIGLLCTSSGSLPICNAATLLSAVYCVGGSNEIVSRSTNATLNATYEAQRELLRSPSLGIVDAQDASSGISTANTTNHAAPSDNPVLSPTDVAIVSSTIVIAVCASVGGVILVVLIKKRKFVRQQLGRLNPGEVFRRAIVVRVARTTDLDDLSRMGLHHDDPNTVHSSPHGTLEYPLLDQNEIYGMSMLDESDLDDDGGSSINDTVDHRRHRQRSEPNPLSSIERQKGSSKRRKI